MNLTPWVKYLSRLDIISLALSSASIFSVLHVQACINDGSDDDYGDNDGW